MFKLIDNSDQKGHGERVADLVFDILGRTAHPLGEDNLLVFADIGDRIGGHGASGQAAQIPIEGSDQGSPNGESGHHEGHDELVFQAKANQLVDHGRSPVVIGSAVGEIFYTSSAHPNMAAPKYGFFVSS